MCAFTLYGEDLAQEWVLFAAWHFCPPHPLTFRALQLGVCSCSGLSRPRRSLPSETIDAFWQQARVDAAELGLVDFVLCQECVVVIKAIKGKESE